MMDTASSVLTGSVAMASCVAALFFLRFWRQTRDSFFLFFAAAFGLDALTRFVLGDGRSFRGNATTHLLGAPGYLLHHHCRHQSEESAGSRTLTPYPQIALIALNARDLEQARGEAAEHWQKRTGLDRSEDKPDGYTIWDPRGGCKFAYRRPT